MNADFQSLEKIRFRTSKLRKFQALEIPLLGILLLAAPSFAASPHREIVSFSVVSNTGIGRSLFVVGNHPDLGAWSPTAGVRLSVSPGNIWSGQVAVRAGTAIEYKFISRLDSRGQHCEPTNVHWMGGANLTSSTPAQPAAHYAGKTVYYHSGLTNVSILFSSAGGAFTSAPLAAIGPGRTPGEFLHKASGVGEAGESIEFVFSGMVGTNTVYDNAPYPGFGSPNNNYFTRMDAFFVQDGGVFDYWPPASVSVSRVVVTNIASSSHPAVPSRNVRIYIPRGYDNSPGRRYPVVYLHDGENVFSPGGVFGSWDADLTATREMSQGRMREAILVGVLGNNTSMTSRIIEYLPPTDSYLGTPGRADAYGRFLIDNVRPTIDTHFRTWNDRRNTLVLGSSMGGLVSAYLAFSTNVFGSAGIFSPAYWTAPNFQAWVENSSTHGARLYNDFGTEEGSTEGVWNDFWNVRASLLRDGYAESLDLLTRIGCGQAHNEAAWTARLPEAFRFLLNPLDQPNELLAMDHPPGIVSLTATSVAPRVTTPTLARFQYHVESAPTPDGPWTPASTTTVETLPWSTTTLAATNPPAPTAIYRILATPAN